ncbi:MAG: hypothetical protein CYG59_13260 [Chloroflexi bacterium]|nr:MAG: hypothetical protein CYG59_13260 [Chloroflexota bacterium]
MSRSFAQTVEVACGSCKQQFNAEVWLIVDAAERPELVAQIQESTMHLAHCPHCGTAHPLDVPLLFHDQSNQLLVFAAQEQSTPQQDQQIARQLGQQLIASIPLAERATYLTTAHTVVGMDDLRRAVMGEMLAAGDELSAGLRALMEAPTPGAVRRVAEAHPVLLTQEALNHLRDYVQQLQAAEHPDLAVALEQRIEALPLVQPHPTLQFIQTLLDAESPEARRALLAARPHDVTPEVPTILEALADQAQRRHLEAVARDMLVIRDEVLGSLGRDIPVTPSA